MRNLVILLTAATLAWGWVGSPVSAQANKNEKDRLYLSTVRALSPLTNRIKDKRLIRSGKAVCKLFDEGVTPSELASDLIAEENSPKFLEYVTAIITSGVVYYCPRHQKTLDRG